MSRHKLISLSVPLFLGVWLLAPISHGADWYPDVRTNQSTTEVQLRSGEIIGSDPVQRAFVTSGTNQFYLVVPSEFRMDASNPEKIVLVNPDYSCFLTFRIVDPVPGETTESGTDYYHELLSSRYPGATILNEFSQTAAGHSGPAFDLQWKSSNGAVQSARVAFITSKAGLLEFSAVTSSNEFSRGQYFLNFLLLTFRSNENGKLVIQPFSDKS